MQPISILKEIYTKKDQDSLATFLNSFAEEESAKIRIQKYLQFRNEKEGLYCPECGSEKYIKNGKSIKKIQKYRCKHCGKGFSEFTNTFLFRIHKKDRMMEFYALSDAEFSLENCRKILGLSKQTVFNWRHKGISSLKGIETETISGIAELITLEMRVSRKGERPNNDEFLPKAETQQAPKRSQRVPKIKVPEGTKESVQVSFCCNRGYDISLNVIQLGELSAKEMINNLWEKLKKVKMLCISENPILKLFVQSKRLQYRISQLKPKKIEREKSFHTLNVEQLINGFSEWLKRFRGVATKYLQNYLNWYLVEVQYKGFNQYLDLFMMFAIYNRRGIKNYQNCRMFIE